MIILIPSYEPDERLLTLLENLRGHRVVVVDDGSGAAFAGVFEEARILGADVLSHSANRGKGAALRTGFAHIETAYPGEDVVCADSDGQHSPVDILRVAAELEATGADAVLGARRFTGTVPLRSRFGNAVTRRAFALATRRTLIDTQTGLRAYPARRLPWLQSVPGDRFEYELTLLLRQCSEGQHVVEVEIATIYLDENSSSHFRPLHDSLRIYGQLLSFAGSSLVGFAVDVVMLSTLMAVTGSLLWSVIGARLVSAGVNFTVNRAWVFRTTAQRVPLRRAVARYSALAGMVLIANLVLMQLLTPLAGLTVAKVVTELSLFVASFAGQRAYVFARGHALTPARGRHESRSTANGVTVAAVSTSPAGIAATSIAQATQAASVDVLPAMDPVEPSGATSRAVPSWTRTGSVPRT